MPERPAPLVFVTTPPSEVPFGSHAAVVADGQRLLAADLSRRFGRLGGAVAPLPATPLEPARAFHWGSWFAENVRAALASLDARVDAIGYAGAGSLALVDDGGLDVLLSPLAGEVVANNRFSADAFAVAGDLDRALDALAGCGSDNAAPRRLAEAGFGSRDLGAAPWARFDVDTTLDLALLRLATRLPGTRTLGESVRSFLEMARLPGGAALEVPGVERIGEVMRDRSGELVVAGRIPAATWQELETQTACRVRAFVEERGMRSARGPEDRPRSLLAVLMERASPAELVTELARLGDAVILDSRVLMAAVAGSSDAAGWPAAEERYASDFGDHARIGTAWLRDLTRAASDASVPFLLGGHALVSDGLRLLVAAAWLGR